ncbi:MAG TPA: NAD(P)H-binding protein [Kofleriaceae bacterium]|nr:NAD(P)H-binding protein [Kofleriaceae bacterium]
MTAYVLGATGFVGREVVRQLCVRGETVIAHVRPDSKSLDDWRKRLGELGATVDTTAWDVPAMAARIRELAPGQVYILIGTTRSKAKADSVEGDIYEKVDLGLTKIAVDAARASETKPRIVYLSGIGASPDARGAYMRARGKAEDVVKGAGLPWVIARPAIITGDRDESRIGERSAAVIGDGLLAVAGVFGGRRLRDRYRSTTPDILASALIRIGEGPEADRAFDGAELR